MGSGDETGRDMSVAFTTDEVRNCRPRFAGHFQNIEGGVMSGVELACTGKAFDRLVAPESAKFDPFSKTRFAALSEDQIQICDKTRGDQILFSINFLNFLTDLFNYIKEE